MVLRRSGDPTRANPDGGDGHRPTPLPGQSPTLWGTPRQTGAARELLTAGKNDYDILLRTNFDDENQARDFVVTLAKCTKYEIHDVHDLFTCFLMARPAIKGRARMEYAQVATGIIAPSLYGVREGKKFRGDEEKANDNNR